VRICRLAAGALLWGALWGCYRYVPVGGDVGVGERVVLDVTDVGRVGLSERLGPGVLAIEGVLREVVDTVYVVSVWALRSVNGERVRWSGEVVRVGRGYVGGMRRREVDRARTWLAAGGVVGGVVLLAATQGLLGFAFESTPPDTTEPPASAWVYPVRVPW
jgi:hypothetical protein